MTSETLKKSGRHSKNFLESNEKVLKSESLKNNEENAKRGDYNYQCLY